MSTVAGVDQAVILVGGQGTRMRPLTDTRPKPMLPLLDLPFVERQVDHLARAGVTTIVFSCGYRPREIEEYFGDGASRGLTMGYVVDPEPLGTAGAIANAAPLLHEGDVFVLNGDILTDLDLAALVAHHRGLGAEATIALTPVDDPSAFGLVRTDADGRVTEFVEKPGPDELIPGEPYRINAGRVGFITTPGEAWTSPDADVDAGARIDPGACIAPGASVAAGARVASAIVGEGASVGEGAVVDGAVVGRDVTIGPGATVTGLVVVGDGATIGAGATVHGPASIDTGAVVGDDDTR